MKSILIGLFVILGSVVASAKDECAEKSIAAARAIARLNSVSLRGAKVSISEPVLSEGESLAYNVTIVGKQWLQLYTVTTVQGEGPCVIMNVSTEDFRASSQPLN